MVSVSNLSTALVVYDPKLPHVALKSHLETVVDKAFKRSLEAAKEESRLLSPLKLWKERIVKGVARGLKYLYIDKELGNKMSQFLIENLHKGSYDRYTHPFAFQDALLEDLKSICSDKHLGLTSFENHIPDIDPDWQLHTVEPQDLTVEQRKYLDSQKGDVPDFSKAVAAEMIPTTDIGYFKIDTFAPLDHPRTKGVIDRAMKKVIHAKALIIDVRHNNGGDPGTVAFLASYLFDKKTLLNQLYQRSNNTLKATYAEPEKLSQIFGGQKPIYVLTSEDTFSAAEELAYDLQSSKRAEVIGQFTAGGAHPVRPYVVDPHFYVIIPFQKAINPYTGKNWEGTGVKPDYSISKEKDALTLARTLLEG